MRKNIKIILLLSAITLWQSCSEEKIVDDVLDGFQNGAILRTISSSTDLDISDESSSFTITLEEQDPEGGALLKEVRVNVGFDDNTLIIVGDDTTDISQSGSLFRTIAESEFTTGDNNLPVTTVTITMGDMLDHLSFDIGDVALTDEFEIDFELELKDGRVFGIDNASGDITRSGTFSFFNSQFSYNAEIKDPKRLAVAETSVKTSDRGLKDGTTDTVFVTFDRAEINTLPTVTRISDFGTAGDVIGDWVQQEDELYYFLYEAGTGDDTVSFELSGGFDVAGFVMDTETIENAYVIDNTSPTPVTGGLDINIEGGNIAAILVTFDFGEVMASDSITYEITSPDFDNITIKNAVTEGVTTTDLKFTPLDGGDPLPQDNISFNVAITGAKDLPGNEVDDDVDIDFF